MAGNEEIIEKRLRRVYQEAYDELKKKLDSFNKAYIEQDAKMRKMLEDGKIDAKDYSTWQMEQIFDGKQWKAKVEHAADTLLHANREAMKIVDGEKMNVFADNAIHMTKEIDVDARNAFGFGIYNSETVSRLIKEEPELLPRKVVNGKKDKAWNRKNIANAVTQGIIQGEDIRSIAKRIAEKTASTNMKAMIRYARTAMTGAENAGRIESMRYVQDKGVKVKKKWLATLDRRTRHSHQLLDGQTEEVNTPFQSIYGDIRFPGDPEAHPGDVYNCRCTLTYVLPDYDVDMATRRDNETKEEIEWQSYNEWKKERNQSSEDGIIEQVDYAEELRRLIAGHEGEWTVDDLVKNGSKFAEIVNAEIAEKKERYEKDEKRHKELRTEISDLRKQINELDLQKRYDEADELEKKLREKEAERNGLRLYRTREELGALSKEKVLETLRKIRGVGGVTEKNVAEFADLNGWSYEKKKLREKTVEAMNYYPSKWLDASSKYERLLYPHWTTGRAYYRHYGAWGGSEIRFDENLDTNIHELGHRFEKVIPEILKLEKEFYEKRTNGEKLEWLGRGYRRDEKTRKDHFISSYMGKEYGGDSYELVSMGFENIYTNYIGFMEGDQEMANWILGILSAL